MTSVITGPPQDIVGGFRLGTVGRHHIDVVKMLFNWRVCETLVDHPGLYDRHWCFPKLEDALVAVALWDGAEDTEPTGWIKAWDGRRDG